MSENGVRRPFDEASLRAVESRAIDIPMRIEFLGVRSYGEGTTTSGVVQITQDLSRFKPHFVR